MFVFVTVLGVCAVVVLVSCVFVDFWLVCALCLEDGLVCGVQMGACCVVIGLV